MGVLQRFERRLGGMVEGLFARAFKSEVQPVVVAAALQRELDAQAAIVGRDRTLVPNRFVVDLGDHDHDRLAPYEQPLTHELESMVREHAAEQRYTFVGPVRVELAHVTNLETGVFHVHSEVVPGPEPDAVPPAAAGVRGSATGPTHDATSAMPSVAASGFGHLVVREGPGAAYEVELRRPVTVIGRATDADIRLTDQAVSRHHAEIRVADGTATVHDLQSTNGTTVNGVGVTTAALADGDEVRLGETTLTYRDPAAATGRADSTGHGVRS